jgi:hypothetical protein
MNVQGTVGIRLTLILAAGLMVWTAAAPAAQEDRFFRHVKQVGRAAVEYWDAEIHVVAAYYYSQRNHDSRWLLVETAMSTTRNMTIDRRNITLVTPGGRAVALATQERFALDVNRAYAVLQNASVTRHDLLSYFSQRSGQEEMRLFALPGDIVLTNFVTDVHHVAVGDLFFESPTGAWESGVYSLVIERDGARASLPIELE